MTAAGSRTARADWMHYFGLSPTSAGLYEQVQPEPAASESRSLELESPPANAATRGPVCHGLGPATGRAVAARRQGRRLEGAATGGPKRGHGAGITAQARSGRRGRGASRRCPHRPAAKGARAAGGRRPGALRRLCGGNRGVGGRAARERRGCRGKAREAPTGGAAPRNPTLLPHPPAPPRWAPPTHTQEPENVSRTQSTRKYRPASVQAGFINTSPTSALSPGSPASPSPCWRWWPSPRIARRLAWCRPPCREASRPPPSPRGTVAAASSELWQQPHQAGRSAPGLELRVDGGAPGAEHLLDTNRTRRHDRTSPVMLVREKLKDASLPQRL